jgi:hypothetical protein
MSAAPLAEHGALRLLLMLGHCERAASAAALGETARHAEHSSASRDEAALFRSVLRQLGWARPSRR